MAKVSRFFPVLVFLLFLASPVFAGPVPDTGQTKCYDNSGEIPCPQPGEPFHGQDAQYQGPARSYTKLGHGGAVLPSSATAGDGWIMTRDNVTGLVWEIKTNDGSIRDRDNDYSWSSAQSVFIAQLNQQAFGGFTDWRLPTVKELSTLVNAGIPYPGPTIDTAWFPLTVSDFYWSSNPDAISRTWPVYFFDGDIYPNNSDSSYVRAVRGGVNTYSMVDNGNGTVTDTETGLMWQKETDPEKYTWQEALSYAEGLQLGGYADWRLPNRNELQTLVDYSLLNPAINPLLEADTEPSVYWSSTTIAGYTDVAWQVYFSSGDVNGSNKSDRHYVRAVRSGQCGSLDHLVISTIPNPQAMNTEFLVTISAKDEYDNTVYSFNQEIRLHCSLGNVFPTRVTLRNGSWQGNVKIYSPGNARLWAFALGKHGYSNLFEVMGEGADSCIVTGVVNYTTGDAVSGVDVTLQSQSDDAEQTVQTADDGSFSFTGLVCGSYKIWAALGDDFESRKISTDPKAESPAKVYLEIARKHNPSGKTPIILIPGIEGSTTGIFIWPVLPEDQPTLNDSRWTKSWIAINGLLNPLDKPGWKTLIDKLDLHDYKLDENLFLMPYDWRCEFKEIVDNFLIKKIDDVKGRTRSESVNIIAHSMGGLVTRYYIKNGYRNDIDRFAMVGTPNQGAANAYYMYFGGDPLKVDELNETPLSFHGNTTEILYLNMKGKSIFSLPHGITAHSATVDWNNLRVKKKARDFYHQHVPSLKCLLPTYEFLQTAEGHTFKINKNDILRELNKDFGWKGVVAKLFPGDGENSTIENINVGFTNDMYPHGEPRGQPDWGSGDGTVLLSRANIGDTEMEEDILEGGHTGLIRLYSDKIIAFIDEGQVSRTKRAIPTITEEYQPQTYLSIAIKGSLNPQIIDPTGNKMGIDPATNLSVNTFNNATYTLHGGYANFSIPDPIDGSYTIRLTSGISAECRIDIGYLDSEATQSEYRTAFLSAGTRQITFEVTTGQDSPVVIDDTPPIPENLRASPSDAEGTATHLSWDPSADPTVSGYNIYSRRDDEPFLTFVGASFEASYATDHPWAVSADIPTRLYAVASFQSDGKESFLTPLVNNNDRDADGLTDAEETMLVSHIDDPDSDNDGLLDGEEYIYGTNALAGDSDGDGFSDLIEVRAGSNPLDADSEPLKGDVDGSYRVELDDAISALRILADITVSGKLNLAADVDNDQRIGMAEAIYSLQWVAGLR